jgi:hypothetical protein
MSRSDDKEKLTPEQEADLRKLCEQSKEKLGDRFLTLAKDDATAKWILKQRMQKRGEKPVPSREIDRAMRRQQSNRNLPNRSADWGLFTELDGIKLSNPVRLPKRPSGVPWDALERFVQLPDSGLEVFKARYPEFLPAWFYGVACGNDAEPDRKTGLMAWQAWRALLRAAWQGNFHPEYVAQLVNIPTSPPGNTLFEVQPVCDAQRAVLAMALESWRARFCPKCGSRFVAREAADKYWPKHCFDEQRREQQRASKRKRARRRAKSSRRTKR